MARILAISSSVSRGAVGLSAIVPALQTAGCEVLAIPAVVLSSRVGYEAIAGFAVPPETVSAMVAALDANGWLAGVDAVLTGYLPEAAHAEAAEEAVRRVKAINPSALYLCDPVLGDDPGGLYVAPAAAAALRGRLVPICDIMTPNRFELSWLSGRTVANGHDAADAAAEFPARAVAVTSVPAERTSELLTVLAKEDAVYVCRSGRREGVPHGTGDLFSALFLAYGLARGIGPGALAAAVAGVTAAIDASAGEEELNLAAVRRVLAGTAPFPVERLR